MIAEHGLRTNDIHRIRAAFPHVDRASLRHLIEALSNANESVVLTQYRILE